MKKYDGNFNYSTSRTSTTSVSSDISVSDDDDSFTSLSQLQHCRGRANSLTSLSENTQRDFTETDESYSTSNQTGNSSISSHWDIGEEASTSASEWSDEHGEKNVEMKYRKDPWFAEKLYSISGYSSSITSLLSSHWDVKKITYNKKTVDEHGKKTVQKKCRKDPWQAEKQLVSSEHIPPMRSLLSSHWDINKVSYNRKTVDEHGKKTVQKVYRKDPWQAEKQLVSSEHIPPMKSLLSSHWDINKVSYNRKTVDEKGKKTVQKEYRKDPRLTEKELVSEQQHIVETTRSKAVLSYWDIKKITYNRKIYDDFGRKIKVETEYRKCPRMTEKQQVLSEYLLPLVLPAIFYLMNFSPFGLKWCMVIVTGHTLETLITDFGANVKGLRMLSCISPLMHHFIDCIWLHSLISGMILMPLRFVPLEENEHGYKRWHVLYCALLLIQTLPIYLAVSFNTHYFKNLTQSRKEHRVNSNVIENHISMCFIWYITATLLLYVALCYEHLTFFLTIGTIILNIVPIALFTRYSSIQHGRTHVE